MTEKYDLDDESNIVWNDEIVETNVTDEEDEDQFVKSILGEAVTPHEEHSTPTPTRDSDEKPDNKITLQAIHDKRHSPYETPGGKRIRIVKDDWGSFWHVEFMSGGQLPEELSGKYTSDDLADAAVRLYLARKE